jgi:two-component system sensor histidine kinase MprB
MTFSVRVALITAAAVAIAAIGAAILMYLVVANQFLDQIDNSLEDAARIARQSGPLLGSPVRPGEQRPFGRDAGRMGGRADVFAQSIDANGNILHADLNQPDRALVTTTARSVAASGHGDAWFDTTAGDGTHVRVYVVALGSNAALEVARSIDEIDEALAKTRFRLGLVAFGGVLLAAALGAAVARAALTPVRRLTNIVEEVSRTRDLSQRVSTSSNDELGRLAASFNVMLGELEMSLRQQRQLVADASHELRTPLTSLRTNLELLERGQPADPAERQQVIGELVGQMERLSTLVSDLIDLARDEKTQLVVEDVRLDELTTDAIAEMRLRYPNVRFEVTAAPSTVRGVRSRILRAITNLLDNAGKWSPAGGLVEVAVRGPEITVRDHGPGIAPEDEAHVFDRFWRAPTARSLPGSGLGLAIVKDVADTHGGRVTLERPADGGASFRLRLASS